MCISTAYKCQCPIICLLGRKLAVQGWITGEEKIELLANMLENPGAQISVQQKNFWA